MAPGGVGPGDRWRRIEEAPRIRTFPYLRGWAVLYIPVDVFPERRLARMFMGEFLGLPPGEPIELRARRYVDEDHAERTYWAFALTPAAMRRWSRRAARARLARMRARHADD